MANKKITELTELTSPAGADLFAIVDDTDTTTKKVTVSNLMTQAPVQAADIDGLATQVSLGNHAALTSAVHGISAFGATLVDDADESAARTTLGLGTAATSASTDFSPAFFSTVSETTTARTLSDSDNGKVIVCSNSSPTIVTVPNGLTTGFSCTVVQSNTATVSVVGSGGASVVGYNGNTATAGQYAALNVIPTATNSYVLEGDATSPPFVNNYSLSLDGIDDYASTPSDKTLTSANKSFSGWFKFTSLTGTKTVWGHPNGYQTSFAIWDASTGTIFFRTSAGNNNISTGSSFGTNWFHLAVTGDGTDLKVYYNGSLAATSLGTDGDWYIRDFFKTGTTGIQNPIYFYGGNAEEFAIWDGTTLSASDVLAIANTGAGSGSRAVDLSAYSGLTHWWRFGDGDTGTTVSDKVGSYNLTLVNGPTFVAQTP